jgi:hypothetical protein
MSKPGPAVRACVVVSLLLLPCCAYYSFTGATIPAHLNTIAIPLVEDNSISTVTSLDEQLTQLLVGRFVNQTRLSLEPSEDAADAVLLVTISRYQNQPTSVTGDERATRNRVTISVTARYMDQVEDREILSSSFSGFDEYDPFGELGLEGENVAAARALEIIADDIFTRATSNW